MATGRPTARVTCGRSAGKGDVRSRVCSPSAFASPQTQHLTGKAAWLATQIADRIPMRHLRCKTRCDEKDTPLEVIGQRRNWSVSASTSLPMPPSCVASGSSSRISMHLPALDTGHRRRRPTSCLSFANPNLLSSWMVQPELRWESIPHLTGMSFWW